MKKILIIAGLTALCSTYCSAQKFDTLYYDKDWKIAKNALFASYYRLYDASDKSPDGKPFRDYYISGQLQAEGNYITIDKYDDSKSVFDGELINYYKNGQRQYKRFEKRGVVEGEYFAYYENGNLNAHAFFKNGNLDGVRTVIDENGVIYQEEFVNGESKGFYYMGTPNGLFGKVNSIDGKVIFESPKPEEQQTAYNNGISYHYYQKNGVQIVMSITPTKEYGKKWYQVGLMVTNNSLAPFTIGTNNIIATTWVYKGSYYDLTVWSADQFIRRIKRQQNFAAIAVGIAEGLNSALGDDGITASHSESYSQKKGFESSTTVTYNSYEAQLQRTMRQNQLIDWENSMIQERIAKNEGYLRRTTINPGEAISGYFYIEDLKLKNQGGIEIKVSINGAIYPFVWK